MSDLAPLGLVVHSNDVALAERRLENFSREAGRAERATDTFRASTAKADTASAGLARAASAAGAAIASIGLISLAREVLQLADAWTGLQSRLRLATTSASQMQKATSELFAISQRARVVLEATVELYGSLSRSTQALGVSQDRLLRVTETISKSLTISGASAGAAQAALMQLGQGFASGALRGDELNSVLEQTPRLAQAIAAGMGVTVGQLRALGAEGKITAQSVFTALEGQRDVIEAEFSGMTTTVSQAFVQLRNAVLKYVGDADQAAGVSRTLAEAVSLAAQNIDGLAKTAGVVASVIGLAVVGAVGSYVVTSTAATVSSIAMGAALAGMSTSALAGSVAVRGLGLALSFFGGPIGLAIAAVAAGLGLVAMESMKARAESTRLAEEMAGTKQALDAYEEAAGDAATATGEARTKALAHAEALRIEASAAITAARALREKQVALAEAESAEKKTRQDRSTSTWIGAMAGAGSGFPTGALAAAVPEAAASRKVASAKGDVEIATKKQADAEARYAKILAGSSTPAAAAAATATGELSKARNQAADAMARARESTADYISGLERELSAVGLTSNGVRRLAADREIELALQRGDTGAAARIKSLILETEKMEGLATALEEIAEWRKKALADANDPITTIPQGVVMDKPDVVAELTIELERAAREAADIRYAVDDIFYGIREKNWAGAFAGLFSVIGQLQKAFDATATKSQRMGAVGGVLTGVGGAVGGKVGAGIGAVGSGFSAASAVTTAATTMKAMGGAAAGFSGAIAGLAGPIGIAVAGFSLLSGILGDQKAKKRAKLEKEAQDIQNARAAAQEQANQRAELQLRVLELSGDEVGALTSKREAELAALDGANRALAQHVYALEDWAKMVGTAKDAVTKAEQDLRDAYEADRDRLTGIIGGVEKARDRLRDAYGRERSAIEGTISTVRTLVESFADFRNELDLMAVANDPTRQYGYAQRQFAGASNDNLVERGRAFAEASQSASVSDLAFQRDLAAVRRRTDEAARTAEKELSTAERQLMALDAMVKPLLGANDNLLSVDAAIRGLTTAEQDAALAVEELARLDAQVGALITINSSVLTVVQAVNNLQGALGALAAAQAAKPTESAGGATQAVGLAGYVDKNGDLAALYASGGGMAAGRTKEQFAQYHWERYGQAEGRTYTAFAAGGDHTGGWRLVGEEGPELESTGPSRIFSADQTAKMLGGDTSRLEMLVEQLTEEVAQLRKEQAQNNFEIRRNTKDSAEAMAKVTRGGDAVRTVAA